MLVRTSTSTFFFVAIVAGIILMVGVQATFYQNPSHIPFPSESSTGGLILSTSVNATTLYPGQWLGINISLFNKSPVSNYIRTADNWTVRGFPISVWPGCLFNLPFEFTIVRGNLSLTQIKAMGNGTGTGYYCMEATSVDHLIFLPKSSNVTLTGTYCGGACVPNQTYGPYRTVSNFAVKGYWDYPVTSNDSKYLYSPYDGGVTFRYPEVGPIAAHAFDQGVYTLIVSDEWDQTVLVHFSVVEGGQVGQVCSSANKLQGLPIPTEPWFTVGVNYAGPWEAVAVVHDHGSLVTLPCYSGNGQGYFEYQSPSLSKNATIVVTASKLDNGTGTLFAAVNGNTNSTTLPFGAATVRAPADYSSNS